MRLAEIVGGVAFVGVAVLLGIALADDGATEVITAETSPFVFDRGTTTTTTTSSATSTVPRVSTATSEAARTTAATTLASTTPASPPAPTTTLIPVEQRSAIAVRVVNGGARALAATNMTAALRGAGFAPVGPADARVLVDSTRVFFAPGRELDAATVNEVVRTGPDNVVPAINGDPNWAQFGGNLAVLVVLGPAGT